MGEDICKQSNWQRINLQNIQAAHVAQYHKKQTTQSIYLFELMFLFSLDVYPAVELLGRMVVLFLVFWQTFIPFSIMAAPIYIPTNSVRGFPFLHVLTNICYLCFFWWWPFWQVWGDISLWFWFAFPWWLAMLSIVSCVPVKAMFYPWELASPGRDSLSRPQRSKHQKHMVNTHSDF